MLSRAEAGNPTSLKPVEPLIIGRDLIFSISMGFRFLFFWCLAGLPSVTGPQNIIFPSEVQSVTDLPTYSWELWGAVGSVLKWLSLLATVGIVVLQVLWRMVDAFSKRGPVYAAECIIEIALSVLFISVLLSNIIYSPRPRSQAFISYLAPIVAFLFGAGVAAGNIFSCKFFQVP
jgi:hypothetical protein